MKPLNTLWAVRFGLETANLFSRCAMTQAAAALAYFLTLTLFPLLLCISELIGLLHADLEQLLLWLRPLLPEEVLSLLLDFLDYAARSRSPAVSLMALGAILLSASAGIRTLLHTLDRLHGRKPGRGPGHLLLSGCLAALVLLGSVLAAALLLTGSWLFRMLSLGLAASFPPAALAGLWQILQYGLLFCFMLLLVLGIYWLGSPPQLRNRRLLVCAALTAAALAGSSGIFSRMVGMSSRYSLLYGSLAAMVVLLVWLYLGAIILLLGAAAGKAAENLRYNQQF